MNQNTGKLIMDKVMGLPIIVFFTPLFFLLMSIFMLGYVMFRYGKNPYTHKSCGMHKSCFLQQTKPQQQTTPTLTNKQVVLSIQQLISIIEQTEALKEDIEDIEALRAFNSLLISQQNRHFN